MAADCIFCRIAAGEIPARLAYQDDQVVAFHDLHPAAPVHILVIPRKHIPTVPAIAPEDEPVVGHLLRAAGIIAGEQGLSERGFRGVINSGRDAGQEVMHLHLHLLGGREFGWPPG